jgi:hypothetical protein
MQCVFDANFGYPLTGLDYIAVRNEQRSTMPSGNMLDAHSASSTLMYCIAILLCGRMIKASPGGALITINRRPTQGAAIVPRLTSINFRCGGCPKSTE